MENFRFLKWEVYRNSKIILNDALKIYKKLPHDIKYNMGDQLISSSSSIILNIAEGSGKNSDKELNRFFNIAIGSAYESLANIDVLRDNKYITQDEFDNIFRNIQSTVKQLGGFKKKLEK